MANNKDLITFQGLSAFKAKLDLVLATKEDNLTSQTAYSEKGSATKIPQITTNTKGQVTLISEIDIRNYTIQLQKNGSNVGSFTLNDSQNRTINFQLSKSDVSLGSVVNKGMDNSPTSGSDNYVKSGGVYSAIQDVREVAEGKTNTYVMSCASATGYENGSLNSNNDTITFTFVANTKFKDISNQDVLLADLKVGDELFIVETDVPDRWVGSIDTSGSTNTITVYKLETKLDVTATPTQNSSKLFTAGGAYTQLALKQNVIDSSNKLSSDLVDDTNHTNKFVTASEKTAWNAKYDKPSGGIPFSDLASTPALASRKVQGTGVLSGGGDLTADRTITHNQVLGTAKTTASVYELKLDAYGHASEATAVAYASVNDIEGMFD